MYLSKYFYKGQKDIKDNLPVSLNRLIRGCFISQESTGIVRFLPLGLKVLKKIVAIVEEEMDKVGIQLELPFLQSTDLWKKSGRYDIYGKEMLRIYDRNNKEFILPPTCEEAIFDVFTKVYQSYKDLPKTLYQISWKFRDELRPRGGLFRGRLFLMKDSYSFNLNQESAHEDYVAHFNTYVNIFKKLGLDVYSIRADSGEIGGDLSHEFVIINEEGDGSALLHKKLQHVKSIDEIKEISGVFDESIKEKEKSYNIHTVIELGHIFYYDTKYAEKLDAKFTNKDGTLKHYFGGCYGMGISRLMGVLAMEKFWPINVSPFQIYMIHVEGYSSIAVSLYDFLKQKNIDVLYDDRTGMSMGEKKHDMDLIGIPIRIIIGKKIELYDQDKEIEFFESIEELYDKIKIK